MIMWRQLTEQGLKRRDGKVGRPYKGTTELLK